MSNDANIQVVSGNLVDDCSMTPLKSGDRHAISFALISNFSWRTASGETHTHSERFNAKCYIAEGRKDYFKDRLTKGAKILLSGRTVTEKYEKNGRPEYWRYVLVEADDITFVSRPSSTRDREQEPVGSAPAATSSPSPATQSAETASSNGTKFRDLCNF